MRAKQAVISNKQADQLISLLQSVKSLNAGSLIEMDYQSCEQGSYYARNSEIVRQADELYAFRVNQSKGTSDTIDKAYKKNIPVFVRDYCI